MDHRWLNDTRLMSQLRPEHISDLDLDFRELIQGWDAELIGLAFLLATIAAQAGTPVLAR